AVTPAELVRLALRQRSSMRRRTIVPLLRELERLGELDQRAIAVALAEAALVAAFLAALVQAGIRLVRKHASRAAALAEWIAGWEARLAGGSDPRTKAEFCLTRLALDTLTGTALPASR